MANLDRLKTLYFTIKNNEEDKINLNINSWYKVKKIIDRYNKLLNSLLENIRKTSTDRKKKTFLDESDKVIEIEKNQKFIFIRSERERILTDLDVKIQDFETFYNEKFFKLFLLNIREVNKLKNSNINFVNYDKFFYDIEKLEKLGNYSGDDKYEITNILEDFYYVVVLVNTIKHVDNNKSLLSKKFRIQIYEFQEQEKIQKQKIKEEEEEKKKDSKTKQIKTKEKDDIIPIQSYSNKSQYNYLKPKENGSNVFILPRNNTTNLEVFKNCVDLDKSKKLKMNMKYFRVLQHLFEEKKDLFKENSNIKRFFELILHEKIHINKFFISGENSEDETLFLDLIYFFTNLQTNSNEIDLKFSNIKLNNDIIVEINKMLTEKLNAKKIDDNVISWDKITDMDGNQIYITDEYGNKINISFGPKIMKLRFRNMIKSININEGKVLLNISERFYPSNASKLKKVFNNILKLVEILYNERENPKVDDKFTIKPTQKKSLTLTNMTGTIYDKKLKEQFNESFGDQFNESFGDQLNKFKYVMGILLDRVSDDEESDENLKTYEDLEKMFWYLQKYSKTISSIKPETIRSFIKNLKIHIPYFIIKGNEPTEPYDTSLLELLIFELVREREVELEKEKLKNEIDNIDNKITSCYYVSLDENLDNYFKLKENKYYLPRKAKTFENIKELYENFFINLEKKLQAFSYDETPGKKIYISLPFIFPGEIKKTTDKVTEILGVSPNIIYPKHFDFLSPNTLYDNLAELKIDEFMTCDDNYKDSYLGMTFEHISLIKGNNLLEPYSKINGNNYNKLTNFIRDFKFDKEKYKGSLINHKYREQHLLELYLLNLSKVLDPTDILLTLGELRLKTLNELLKQNINPGIKQFLIGTPNSLLLLKGFSKLMKVNFMFKLTSNSRKFIKKEKEREKIVENFEFEKLINNLEEPNPFTIFLNELHPFSGLWFKENIETNFVNMFNSVGTISDQKLKEEYNKKIQEEIEKQNSFISKIEIIKKQFEYLINRIDKSKDKKDKKVKRTDKDRRNLDLQKSAESARTIRNIEGEADIEKQEIKNLSLQISKFKKEIESFIKKIDEKKEILEEKDYERIQTINTNINELHKIYIRDDLMGEEPENLPKEIVNESQYLKDLIAKDIEFINSLFAEGKNHLSYPFNIFTENENNLELGFRTDITYDTHKNKIFEKNESENGYGYEYEYKEKVDDNLHLIEDEITKQQFVLSEDKISYIDYDRLRNEIYEINTNYDDEFKKLDEELGEVDTERQSEFKKLNSKYLNELIKFQNKNRIYISEELEKLTEKEANDSLEINKNKLKEENTKKNKNKNLNLINELKENIRLLDILLNTESRIERLQGKIEEIQQKWVKSNNKVTLRCVKASKSSAGSVLEYITWPKVKTFKENFGYFIENYEKLQKLNKSRKELEEKFKRFKVAIKALSMNKEIMMLREGENVVDFYSKKGYKQIRGPILLQQKYEMCKDYVFLNSEGEELQLKYDELPCGVLFTDNKLENGGTKNPKTIEDLFEDVFLKDSEKQKVDEIKSQVNEKFKKLIKEEDNKLKLYDNDDIFFWYLVNSEAISYEDKKEEFAKRTKLKKKKLIRIEKCIKKKSEIAAEKHEKLKNMLINKPLKNDRYLTNKITVSTIQDFISNFTEFMDQFTPNVNDGYLPKAIEEHTINSAILKAKEKLDLLTNGMGNKLLLENTTSDSKVLLLKGGAGESLVIAQNNSEVVLFGTENQEKSSKEVIKKEQDQVIEKFNTEIKEITQLPLIVRENDSNEVVEIKKNTVEEWTKINQIVNLFKKDDGTLEEDVLTVILDCYLDNDDNLGIVVNGENKNKDETKKIIIQKFNNALKDSKKEEKNINIDITKLKELDEDSLKIQQEILILMAGKYLTSLEYVDNVIVCDFDNCERVSLEFNSPTELSSKNDNCTYKLFKTKFETRKESEILKLLSKFLKEDEFTTINKKLKRKVSLFIHPDKLILSEEIKKIAEEIFKNLEKIFKTDPSEQEIENLKELYEKLKTKTTTATETKTETKTITIEEIDKLSKIFNNETNHAAIHNYLAKDTLPNEYEIYKNSLFSKLDKNDNDIDEDINVEANLMEKIEKPFIFSEIGGYRLDLIFDNLKDEYKDNEKIRTFYYKARNLKDENKIIEFIEEYTKQDTEDTEDKLKQLEEAIINLSKDKKISVFSRNKIIDIFNSNPFSEKLVKWLDDLASVQKKFLNNLESIVNDQNECTNLITLLLEEEFNGVLDKNGIQKLKELKEVLDSKLAECSETSKKLIQIWYDQLISSKLDESEANRFDQNNISLIKDFLRNKNGNLSSLYEPLTKDEINKFLRDKKGNRILYVIKKNGGYYRAGLSTFTLDKKSLISLLKKINLNLKEEDTTNVDDEITDDIKISYDPAVIESMLEEVEISDIFDINSAEELNELNTIIVEKLSRHKNIELKEKYVKWYESLNIIRKTPKNRKVKNLVSNSLDILKQMNNGLVINLNETFNSSYPMTSIYLDMERGIITPYDPINAICYEKKEDKSTMTPIEDKEEKEEDPKKKVERKIEYSLEDKMFESITIDGENGLDLKEEYYLYYSYLGIPRMSNIPPIIKKLHKQLNTKEIKENKLQETPIEKKKSYDEEFPELGSKGGFKRFKINFNI